MTEMPSKAYINPLRLRQNYRHLADDIFICILLNENVRILLDISLKFVQINNIPALVQIMAWRRPGDKPLSETMTVTLLMHIFITRPQWVKHYVVFFQKIWLMWFQCTFEMFLWSYELLGSYISNAHCYSNHSNILTIASDTMVSSIFMIAFEAVVGWCKSLEVKHQCLTHMWILLSLVQIMACCLFAAKPLPEPVLTICQMDPTEQHFIQFESNPKTFLPINWIWKYDLQNDKQFGQASLCLSWVEEELSSM